MYVISYLLHGMLWWDWIGLDLFNDDTSPSGHISRPTQVNVSQSCFNSLNILLKLDYIVQVWALVEVNCIISDRRIPLLAGIPLCKSRELSRREYSMNQLCSNHHDIPVTLHTPGAYGQWSVFDHNGDKYSLLMHCIKIKSPAKSLLNEQSVFAGGNIFFFVCYHVVPKRHSQLDYELNGL